MTTLDPILEAAELRMEPLELLGQKLIVREPSAIESIEYRSKRNGQPADKVAGTPAVDPDPAGAMAYLMHLCVLNAETGLQRWTLEQATKVANGREEVWTPIVLILTGFSKREKKASPPPSDSTTG